MSVEIEMKNISEGGKVLMIMESLLQDNPIYHCLKLKFLLLKDAPLSEIQDGRPGAYFPVFQKAKIYCFGDLQKTTADFKWISGMIHLVSKKIGTSFALQCIKDLEIPISGQSFMQDSSPALQLLVLNIHFLIENEIENAHNQVSIALNRKSRFEILRLQRDGFRVYQ